MSEEEMSYKTKTICIAISMEEYKELLLIKGKYQELKEQQKLLNGGVNDRFKNLCSNGND